jgi:hypothetical protein
VSDGAHELLALLYRHEHCDGKGLISAAGLTTGVINDDVERMKEGIADFSAMQTQKTGIPLRKVV